MEGDYGSFEARAAVHSLSSISHISDGEIKEGLLAIMEVPYTGESDDEVLFMDTMEQKNVKREVSSAFRAGARFGACLAWQKALEEGRRRIGLLDDVATGEYASGKNDAFETAKDVLGAIIVYRDKE